MGVANDVCFGAVTAEVCWDEAIDVLVDEENENGLGAAAEDGLVDVVLPAKENFGNVAGVELAEDANETLANGFGLAEPGSPVVDCVGFASVVDAKGLEDFCCCEGAGIFGATAPAVPPPPPNFRLLQIERSGLLVTMWVP